MDIFYKIEWTKTPVGQVAFHCPHCRQSSSQGTVIDRHERALLFYVLPVLSLHSTWVTCQGCGRELFAQGKPDQLLGRSPEELDALVRPGASWPAKIVALVAVFLVVIPFLGLLSGWFAWRMNRYSWGWPKLVAAIAWYGSILVTVGFIILMILATTGNL